MQPSCVYSVNHTYTYLRLLKPGRERVTRVAAVSAMYHRVLQKDGPALLEQATPPLTVSGATVPATSTASSKVDAGVSSACTTGLSRLQTLLRDGKSGAKLLVVANTLTIAALHQFLPRSGCPAHQVHALLAGITPREDMIEPGSVLIHTPEKVRRGVRPICHPAYSCFVPDYRWSSFSLSPSVECANLNAPSLGVRIDMRCPHAGVATMWGWQQSGASISKDAGSGFPSQQNHDDYTFSTISRLH